MVLNFDYFIRHSRESGNPVPPNRVAYLDPRFREGDESIRGLKE